MHIKISSSGHELINRTGLGLADVENAKTVLAAVGAKLAELANRYTSPAATPTEAFHIEVKRESGKLIIIPQTTEGFEPGRHAIADLSWELRSSTNNLLFSDRVAGKNGKKDAVSTSFVPDVSFLGKHSFTARTWEDMINGLNHSLGKHSINNSAEISKA